MRTALRAGALCALVATVVAHPSVSIAGPAEYVFSPIVEEGEREIEARGGSARLRDDTRESQEAITLGLGLNRWWFTEVAALWHKEPGERQAFDAWEWENRFQLTETGRTFADLGFVLEIERPRDRREGYEYRWGPLLQADFGQAWQGNLNFLIGKHIRASEPTEAEFGYQWQFKNRWRRELEFGVQGFGELGPWDHWAPSSEQAHVAGPALFGRIGVRGQQAVRYDAALLLPLNHGAPRNTVRARIEYEF
jgi:hypothetical protein